MHKTLRYLSKLTLVAAVLAAGCSKTAKIEDRLAKISEYMAEENFASAEVELKNVLRDDPRNATAISQMGSIYFMQGRYREAFPYLNASKSFDPENLENRSHLAALLIYAGRPDLARSEAVEILAKDPSNSQAPLIVSDSIRSAEFIQEGYDILGKLEKSAASLAAIAFVDMKRQSLTAAEAKLDEALALDPEFAPAYAGKFAIASIQNNQEAALEAAKNASQFSEERSGMKTVYVDFLVNQQGNIEAGIKVLEDAYANTPDYLPYLSKLAELHFQAQNLKKAKEFDDKALKLDPLDPNALRLKGVLTAAEGDYDDAIAILEKVVELFPNDAKAHYQLGLAYVANKEPQKALEPLMAVMNRNPANFEAAALLANAQSNQGDFSGAVITLRRLVEANPRSAEAKLLLAEAYNKQGNFDGALAIYEEVDASMPTNPNIDYLSGVTQLQRDNRVAARSAFEEALKSNPLHLQSVEQLTRLDLSEQSYESALARIENSIDLAPDTAILYVVKAQVLAAMGQVEASEATYMDALEIEPESRMARTLLCRLYVSQNQNEQAIEQLQIVLETNPDDVVTLSNLATIYEKIESYDEAIATYEKVVELAPRNLMALNNLAYIISTQEGPTDKAKELAEQARVVAPTSPYTADTLGWILFQRGEYLRARALLLDSLSKLPDNHEVKYHVGAASYYLGNIADATSYLTAATNTTGKYTGIERAQEMLRVIQIDAQSPSAEERELIATLIEGEDPIAILKGGQIKQREGNTEEAIEDFRAALKIAPNNIRARIELALALSEQGNTEEAIELGRSAAQQAPNNLEVTFAQGIIAYRSGNYTWASSLLSQASRQMSQRGELFDYLWKAQLATGNLTASIESAEKLASIDSNSDLDETIIGLRMLQQNDLESIPSNLAADSLLYQMLSAKAAEKSERYDEASAAYQEILKLYPNQAQAKLGLASIYAEKGESLARAYELSSESRNALGATPETTELQAVIRYKQKQYDQAYRLFSQLSASQVSSNERKFYFADSALKSNHSEQAKTLLEELSAASLDDELAQQVEAALSTL